MKTLKVPAICFSLFMTTGYAAFGQSLGNDEIYRNGDMFFGIDPGIGVKFTF
ncbi:MAG: hypothetical protein WCE64_11245 [Bacteroidales bacterium]